MIPKHLDHRIVAGLVAASLVALAAGGALLVRGNDGPDSPLGLLSGDGSGSSASTSATVSAENPSAPTTRTSDVIGRDHTKQSVAPSRTANPDVPPATGAVLSTITTPPSRTLALVPRDNATAGSEYKVVVRVYGWGPVSASIPSAVVLVTESTPVGDVAKPLALNGRTVLVKLDPAAAEALTRGGSYTGVITLRLSGDTLIPWLGDVAPAQ